MLFYFGTLDYFVGVVYRSITGVTFFYSRESSVKFESTLFPQRVFACPAIAVAKDNALNRRHRQQPVSTYVNRDAVTFS